MASRHFGLCHPADARTIGNAKLYLSRAKKFFALGHQNFGRVWAGSGLRQAYCDGVKADSWRKQVGRGNSGGGRAASEGIGVDPRLVFECFVC